MRRAGGVANAKIGISGLYWYMPKYTPNKEEQAILSKQTLIQTPSEFYYLKTYVFMKEVNTQKVWTFELETQKVINVPFFVIAEFQQTDQ